MRDHAVRRSFATHNSSVDAIVRLNIILGAKVSALPDETDTVQISLTVNGTDYALAFDARTTLLDALREHLDLTGTKKGCDQGQSAPVRCW